jgi:hypothetical protein
MSTTLMERRLNRMDDEIAAIATTIEKEKKELKDERTGGKDQDIINDLKESIARLSTEKGKLIDERMPISAALAAQPTQGKFTRCQYVVTSLCHDVDRFPNSYVVSLSKCVLSVELTLFEALSSQIFTFRPPPLGLLSERVVL